MTGICVLPLVGFCPFGSCAERSECLRGGLGLKFQAAVASAMSTCAETSHVLSSSVDYAV